MKTTEKQQKLSNLIEEKLAELQLPPLPSSLYDPVRYTLGLGGKRIRPFFTLTGCELCNGNPREAVSAALAIELLHNFTLLHDDIMDAAHTRRGKPSVYKKWDSSTAILSGDAMYAWAFEQLQYYGYDDRYSKKQYVFILDIFLESARLVCEGQAFDLEFETEGRVSLMDYLNMVRGKTAALVSGAFRLGGAVADASSEWMENLHKLGMEIGIAFQIQDDLLDATADPSKFGKRLGGDIAEGKKTYLSILSLQRGSSSEKIFLQKVFMKEQVSDDDIREVIDLYRSLGIIEETSAEYKKHYNNAIKLLNVWEDTPAKRELIEFLDNLINREY